MINIPFDVISSWPTGSRYICNPAPMDTDEDTVILVSNLKEALSVLLEQGWTIAGSESYEQKEEEVSIWFSAKRSVEGTLYNFIVTTDEERFRRWVTATELSKKLNLLKKQDRIAVFQVIVDEQTMW